jgi:hypothetical protein
MASRRLLRRCAGIDRVHSTSSIASHTQWASAPGVQHMIAACPEAANSEQRFSSDWLHLLFSRPTMRIRSLWWLARVAPLLGVLALALAVSAAGARAETGDDATGSGATVDGSWSATGSLPEAWSGGSVATLADGQVIAVDGGVKRTTVMYNPSTGLWSQGPVLPGTERDWTVIALSGGGALLLGETVCTSRPWICHPTTSTYLLNAKETEWLPAAPMHEARVHPLAVRLADGRELVAGGFGDNCEETVAEGFSCAPLASAEVYDPTTGEWTVTAPMPQANGGGSATLLSDGSVLVAGGTEDGGAVRYEPTSGTWTAAGQTLSSRSGALLFGLPGGRALAIGSRAEAGFYGSLGGAESRRKLVCEPITAEIFTAALDTWAASPPTPTGGENCVSSQGVLLAGGDILLGASGYKEGENKQESMYVLDPEQRCWSATGPEVEPRAAIASRGGEGGVMVALADGRALLFGGRLADGQSSAEQYTSAEIYTPGPDPCPPPGPSLVGSETGPHSGVSPEPGPGPAPGPTTASPRFTGARIVRHGHLAIARAGSIQLLVQCPASAVDRCVGNVRVSLLLAASARGSAKGHTRNMFLGEGWFVASSGRTTTASVTLTQHRRTLAALLRQSRHATVILTSTAHDGTDQLVTITTLQTLR